MSLPSVYVYGMPISRIASNRYAGQYGNATRSIGLAYNLCALGHRVALEVEDDFTLDGASATEGLEFVKNKDRGAFLPFADCLLISCTNLESFENTFEREAYLEHPCRVFTCCFDLGQTINLSELLVGTKLITFNNRAQRQMWDLRCSGIPSVTIPYGVAELDLIDSAIVDDISRRAIWMGEFRRPDMLQRVVRFAIANPECEVSVVTRKIFDSAVDPDERGGRRNPYADFREKPDPDLFDSVVQLLCGQRRPANIRFLGSLEGENHTFLGSHSIGLDFSRFPSQTHDNTKIMDYLRSGLTVVCDRGTPSYRFVEEMRHGVILEPEFTIEDAQRAYRECRQACNLGQKQLIAARMREKYGWPVVARQVSSHLCRIVEHEHLYCFWRNAGNFFRYPVVYLRKWKNSFRPRATSM